jgi:lysophospholipase L1-like esterase
MFSLSACALVGCLLLGDSLAVGLAAGGMQHRAIVGIGAAHPSIVQQITIQTDYKIFIVSVGTNDSRNISQEVRRIQAAADAAGKEVIFLLPPCLGGGLEDRARQRRAEIRQFARNTIDLSSLPEGRCGAHRAPDGVHFTATGYRRLFEQAFGSR